MWHSQNEMDIDQVSFGGGLILRLDNGNYAVDVIYQQSNRPSVKMDERALLICKS